MARFTCAANVTISKLERQVRITIKGADETVLLLEPQELRDLQIILAETEKRGNGYSQTRTWVQELS